MHLVFIVKFMKEKFKDNLKFKAKNVNDLSSHYGG